jgi:hypothetical protein
VAIRTGLEPAITRLKASWLNHSPTGSKVWRCGSDLNRHLSDRQSDALPLSYCSGDGKRPRGGRLPNVVRPPATRRKARKSAARQRPNSLHTRACLRSSHDTHYPLPLTTNDALLSIASPLFPTYRELGRPDLPGVTEHNDSAKRIAVFLSRRRRLAAPGR